MCRLVKNRPLFPGSRILYFTGEYIHLWSVICNVDYVMARNICSFAKIIYKPLDHIHIYYNENKVAEHPSEVRLTTVGATQMCFFFLWFRRR